VSRIARSLQEDRWTELLAGFEYNGGCWVGRVVLHRYALSSASNNTAIFFQLELNGLGSLGNDPGSLLRRAVPGYGRIAPTGPERSLESGW
jgi:LPS-assembly protein